MGFLVSKDSVCGRTWRGMPLLLLLQTAWAGVPGEGPGSPGRGWSALKPVATDVTVPWIEAACGL